MVLKELQELVNFKEGHPILFRLPLLKPPYDQVTPHSLLTSRSVFLQVVGRLQNKSEVIDAARIARPNVTAFAYFSSAVNPILYVFAGSSHIRQAGLSFMGRLFEATYSESRSTTTRSGRISSSSKESTVLKTLSVKMGKPFKGKKKEFGNMGEQNEPELKTLASVEPLD